MKITKFYNGNFQRNGIAGEGFYSAFIDWKDKGEMGKDLSFDEKCNILLNDTWYENKETYKYLEEIINVAKLKELVKMKYKKYTKEEIERIRKYQPGYVYGEETKFLPDEAVEEVVNLKDRLAEIYNEYIYPNKKGKNK